jgi:hypothetical protein|tara:strand:- start:6908 stop:7339 length:432 start_codon:yes stop_codon:yes gene_type:complete
MRGVSRQPIAYVCESDRDLPTEEQTVFHLIPKNNQMANESIRRYARAASEGRSGAREYDDRLLSVADIEEFQAVCLKVENYCFSEDYCTSHPNLPCDDSGFVAEVEDPNLKADIVRDIPSQALQEIFDAVNNPVKLGRGGKKN